jgi:hypothetical protein
MHAIPCLPASSRTSPSPPPPSYGTIQQTADRPQRGRPPIYQRPSRFGRAPPRMHQIEKRSNLPPKLLSSTCGRVCCTREFSSLLQRWSRLRFGRGILVNGTSLHKRNTTGRCSEHLFVLRAFIIIIVNNCSSEQINKQYLFCYYWFLK